MKKKLSFVFDIDGTLASYNSRGESLREIPPNKRILDLALKAQSDQNSSVSIVTARYENTKDDTEYWIKKHGLEPEVFLMRSQDDDRPDEEVRVDQVKHVRQKLGGKTLLYDDKKSNCQAVSKKLNVTCIHVNNE